jgi:hypothetical protein
LATSKAALLGKHGRLEGPHTDSFFLEHSSAQKMFNQQLLVW